MERKRPLIAAIFAAVHDECQSIVWSGVADYARDKDVDLLTFVATSQNRVSTFDAHYNIIRDLTSTLTLDGLLIYTGALSDHFDLDSLTAYVRSLNTCPIVCISQKVEGYKSVLIDNSDGVRRTVAHLIEEHNCRKFAFIKGVEHHVETQARFASFKEELIKHNIPLDPSMVFKGHFIKVSGEEAARQIIARGDYPDAIIAVNDSTALGLISEFAKHHVHVPTDIRVAGFDDVPEARNAVPSLTTVRQPLSEMARIAMECLVEKSALHDADDIYVPTCFIARQSCGCSPRPGADAENQTKSTRDNRIKIRAESFEADCTAMLLQEQSDIDAETAQGWIRSLIATIPLDLAKPGHSEYFITLLNNLLVRYISRQGNPEIWQDILSGFITHAHMFATIQKELSLVSDIFHGARLSINDFILRKTLSAEQLREETRAIIRSIMLNTITSFDIDRLKNTLWVDLRSIGINACHMVLYGASALLGVDVTAAKQPTRSRLMLSFSSTGDLLPDGPLEFNTEAILPESVWSAPPRKDLLVFPLVFEKLCYGYILFHNNPALPHYVYEELRVHIASALRGHMLMNELRDMSLRDELTGLYNRRGFVHLGNHMIRRARRNRAPVTIMYADLNKLKSINDTYGHGEGDFAIETAARLLKTSIREQDVVARIGGDEFALVATDMDDEACNSILARIDASFAAFNNAKTRPYSVSISIGHTQQAIDENTSIDELLNKADEMLVEIKRNRNRTPPVPDLF